MAIAALMDVEAAPGDRCSPLEVPWPRPTLRVVADTDEDSGEEPGEDYPEAACRPLELRAARDVTARRAQRATRRTRRRRVVLATVAVLLSVGLALPFSILGGSRPGARVAPARAATAGADVYVVQPGDTLWSIASRFDRTGNPRALAEALAKETGSSAVVPGERIQIP